MQGFRSLHSFQAIIIIFCFVSTLACGGRSNNPLIQARSNQSVREAKFVDLARPDPPLESGQSSASSSIPADSANETAVHPAVADTTTTTLHYVSLNWSVGKSVAGYNVYRSTSSSGPFSKLNPYLEAATTFTDYNVAAGHIYYYAVTAVSGTLESPRSVSVVAKVPTP